MATPCEIVEVGKSRAGFPRFWCKTHGAGATGKYGVRLPVCESAHLSADDTGGLELDADAFPGGVAIWGAVLPVFDTSGRVPDQGIHVHARYEAGSKNKAIDASYPSVTFSYPDTLFEKRRVLLTDHAALSFLASRVAGHEPHHLHCVKCGELHLDAEYFAIHPHKRHLCHKCGRIFNDDARGVSNPLALVREKLGLEPPPPVRPGRCLNIKQTDFPGGFQLWGSNPALIWTSRIPEEEGIHVHAYLDRDPTRDPDIDETFDDVQIDGVHLDEVQVRHLMVQRSLTYLKGKVVDLRCPDCGEHHFDSGAEGFHPHANHPCHKCGTIMRSPGKTQKTVCNPALTVLDRLRAG